MQLPSVFWRCSYWTPECLATSLPASTMFNTALNHPSAYQFAIQIEIVTGVMWLQAAPLKDEGT